MAISQAEYLRLRGTCHITERLYGHAPAGCDDHTVGAARASIRAAVERQREATCPCCGNTDKITYIALEQTHGKALIYTVWQHQRGLEWVRATQAQDWLRKYKLGRGWLNAYVNNLVYWGVAERNGDYEKSKRTGEPYEYRLTKKGQRFLLDQESIPRMVMVSQRYRVCGESDERITFSELMQGVEVSRFCNDAIGRLKEKPLFKELALL